MLMLMLMMMLALPRFADHDVGFAGWWALALPHYPNLSFWLLWLVSRPFTCCVLPLTCPLVHPVYLQLARFKRCALTAP